MNEKYIIKKDKEDLLSSLKALDKKLLKQKIEQAGVDNVKALKEYILDGFEMALDFSKDDTFTRVYFTKLRKFENSKYMIAYNQDIESLFVFVYKNEDHYSYYISNEIKKIINKLLGSKGW